MRAGARQRRNPSLPRPRRVFCASPNKMDVLCADAQIKTPVSSTMERIQNTRCTEGKHHVAEHAGIEKLRYWRQ